MKYHSIYFVEQMGPNYRVNLRAYEDYESAVSFCKRSIIESKNSMESIVQDASDLRIREHKYLSKNCSFELVYNRGSGLEQLIEEYRVSEIRLYEKEL